MRRRLSKAVLFCQLLRPHMPQTLLQHLKHTPLSASRKHLHPRHLELPHMEVCNTTAPSATYITGSCTRNALHARTGK